ncbi:LysM peptidoglycan-binding domain-containing protein [Paenibacillaceae bacterium]|nr:LysM peptidoglycan-binding domain-containing protein [Paenibacillaceae bacterium]
MRAAYRRICREREKRDWEVGVKVKIHIVKQGDTLYRIAEKYGVTVEEILKLNPGIANADKIDVGMKIKVPSNPSNPGMPEIMHHHVVQQGDTLWKLAKAWGVPFDALLKANQQLKNPNALMVGEVVNIPKTSGGSGQPMPAQPSQPQLAPGKTPTHPVHPGKPNTAPVVEAPKPQPAPQPIPQPTPKPQPIPQPTPKPQPAPQPIPQPAPKPQPYPQAESKPHSYPQMQQESSHYPVGPSHSPAQSSHYGYAQPVAKPYQEMTGYPVHYEYQQSVDLFQQFNVPAVQAGASSGYGMPPQIPGGIQPMQEMPYGIGPAVLATPDQWPCFPEVSPASAPSWYPSAGYPVPGFPLSASGAMPTEAMQPMNWQPAEQPMSQHGIGGWSAPHEQAGDCPPSPCYPGLHGMSGLHGVGMSGFTPASGPSAYGSDPWGMGGAGFNPAAQPYAGYPGHISSAMPMGGHNYGGYPVMETNAYHNAPVQGVGTEVKKPCQCGCSKRDDEVDGEEIEAAKPVQKSKKNTVRRKNSNKEVTVRAETTPSRKNTSSRKQGNKPWIRR